MFRDHCYGNKSMKRLYPDLIICGSKLDRPFKVNRFVEHEELIMLDDLCFQALSTPGHTNGHFIYRLITKDNVDCLFTGDFVFTAGIGRIFERNEQKMLESIFSLKKFSPSTLLFPGHEYALLNLSFAYSLDRNNSILNNMMQVVREQRRQQLPLVEQFNNLFEIGVFDSHWVS
ncbi:unnamed protein product [Dracunculus medinensis]|uniref:Lactamase_B domain-containing protein n=1 Tax=Dracunculus medinensis TaxID=318479 RepID=A0A0N4UG96_DRAME|nr:unnamed protein product [Dracunculus medinensis]